MTDRFRNSSSGLDGPTIDAFDISPNDAADISEVTRAIYVGSAGDLNVVTKAGTQLLFTGLSGGSVLPIPVSRVLATNTTADNIIGLV